MDWHDVAEYKDQWRALVNTVMNPSDSLSLWTLTIVLYPENLETVLES
jgi:hypothetical protein